MIKEGVIKEIDRYSSMIVGNITLFEEWKPNEDNKEITTYIKDRFDISLLKGYVNNNFIDDIFKLVLGESYIRDKYKDNDLNAVFKWLFKDFPDWDDGDNQVFKIWEHAKSKEKRQDFAMTMVKNEDKYGSFKHCKNINFKNILFLLSSYNEHYERFIEVTKTEYYPKTIAVLQDGKIKIIFENKDLKSENDNDNQKSI